MALCRRVKEAHVNSVVLIRCRKRERGKEKGARGTGFIVHMDPRFCLVMTCGHVLQNHVDGSIRVCFGDTEIGPARPVFAHYAREVCMVRVDQSTSPESFDAIAGYPQVRWAAREARENGLIAILSRMSDPENHLAQEPSVFHGTVCVPPRFEPKKQEGKKQTTVPLHLGYGDYTSVQGNSGSAIFEQAVDDDETVQVIGIHITARDKMARFVCLQGVALVMEEHLKGRGVSVDASRRSSVAYLLEQIVQDEIAAPSSAGAGPSSASAGAGAP